MTFPTCSTCKQVVVVPPQKICTKCEKAALYAKQVSKQDAAQLKLVRVLFRITYKGKPSVERPFYGETPSSAIAVAHRSMIKNGFKLYRGKYTRNGDVAEKVEK